MFVSNEKLSIFINLDYFRLLFWLFRGCGLTAEEDSLGAQPELCHTSAEGLRLCQRLVQCKQLIILFLENVFSFKTFKSVSEPIWLIRLWVI